MTPDWQLMVVLVLIAAASGYVVVAMLQPWRQRGCGSGSGGCGTCSTAQVPTSTVTDSATARRIALPLMSPSQPRGPQ